MVTEGVTRPQALASLLIFIHTRARPRGFLLLMKHFLQESYWRWISDEVVLRRKELENWEEKKKQKKQLHLLICVEPLVFPSTSESCVDHMVGLGMWIYEYVSIRPGWTVFPVVWLWAREERLAVRALSGCHFYEIMENGRFVFPTLRGFLARDCPHKYLISHLPAYAVWWCCIKALMDAINRSTS